MNKDVLVINPWVTDFKLYDEWMHPAGLYLLMSLLEHHGYNVIFIDCLERSIKPVLRWNTGHFPSSPLPTPPSLAALPRTFKRYGTGEEQLRTRLSDLPRRPDLVYIGSGMTYWLEGVRQTVATVRSVLGPVRVVVGGVAATLMPDWVKTHCSCDVFSGSLTSSAGQIRLPHGPHLRTDGWIPSLRAGIRARGSRFHAPVLTATGCPLRCTYCAAHRLHPTFLPRPTPLVADEVELAAQELGVSDFAFLDDALLYSRGRVLFALLDELQRRGVRGRFHLPNGIHLRWFDAVVARRMNESSFRTIRFGYESGDTAFCDQTSSKASLKDVARALTCARENGLGSADIGFYLMAGLPGQRKEQILTEMHRIAELGGVVKPVFLSPVPTTPLFEHYAGHVPRLRTDPHLHNDTFFITTLPDWNWEGVQEVRAAARRLNAMVRHQEGYAPQAPVPAPALDGNPGTSMRNAGTSGGKNGA